MTFMLDGQRLRKLRRQRGLSQEELADQAGISVSTVARLERQLAAPCRGRTLGRLARSLGEHPATTSLRWLRGWRARVAHSAIDLIIR